MRIPKTTEHLLGALEEDLCLLAGAVHGLDAGDRANLRDLATNLRALVCFASVEGLLWRLVDELCVDDHVRVQLHQLGSVNLEHPLARGLIYLQCYRTVAPDPRIPVVTYSLRDFIKKRDAVFILGQG